MKRFLIRLHTSNGAQFRLGQSALDDVASLMHSDTLFGALVNLQALIEGQKQTRELVTAMENGEIKFSSGLFGLQLSWQDTPVYFVPKPALRYERPEQGGANLIIDRQEKKRTGKIQFVSLGVLEDLRNALEEDFVCKVDWKTYAEIGKVFVCQHKELGLSLDKHKDHLGALSRSAFCQTLVSTKVLVHTDRETDRLYTEANLQFRTIHLPPVQESVEPATAQGFFYVLLDCTPKWEEQLKLLFAVMADHGIGGQRTNGMGLLKDVCFDDMPETFKHHEKGKGFSVSLCIPEDQTAFEKVRQYELILRGGGSLIGDGYRAEQDSSNYARKRIQLIREGALLTEPIQGSIKDITPSGLPANGETVTVKRNGLCYALPL